jgi:hypothetical protein
MASIMVHWDVRFGSKADIRAAKSHVRFTPNSDRESEIPQKSMSALGQKRTHAPQQTASLFDHLFGARDQRLRHGKAERFGGFEVDHQFILGRHLDW